MEEARARPDVTSRRETGMFLSSANKALAVRFIKVFAHCRTTRGRFADVPLRVSAPPASIARMRAGSSSVRGQRVPAAGSGHVLSNGPVLSNRSASPGTYLVSAR